MDKLTTKQAAFVREYVIHFNGAQAAVRAGYATKGARRQASRMLTYVHVQEAVKALTEGQAKRCSVKVDDIVARLIEFMDDDKEKTADRLKATELLGKHLGMFEKGREQENTVDWRELLKALREQGHDIKNQYLKIDLDTN